MHNQITALLSHYRQRKGCLSVYRGLQFRYLESEVSTGEGDGVKVNARLQVVGTQHGDTLIESSLNKKMFGFNTLQRNKKNKKKVP